MLPFLQKKSSPVLGIDISATAIKLLELSRSGSRYKVESYAVEPLPANSIVDKNINLDSIEDVGQAISRLVNKSGTKVKDAAIAVSGSSVITKVISMPGDLSEQDMESQIEIEADQYIPFPLDEVAMDFEVLGSTEGNADNVDVMLAAARSETVDNIKAVIESAGLIAKIIDIEAFAVENTLAMMAKEQFGSENEIFAVADIGSAITTFSVTQNMKIVYSREQQFGGAQLTEDIQRRYGLSYEEAGKAKRMPETLPDNYEPEVLEPFKDSMAQQISRAQQFFYASNTLGDIDRLILAGGCASISGVADLIESKVGISTIVANPFANMSVSSKVSTKGLSNDAPGLMIACGLALRSFS